MSEELSISNTFSNPELSSLLLSNLFHSCFFLLSHPLYFSYFIFFSPYLLKFISFLSPLFITTFLLLVAFLTVSPGLLLQGNFHSELCESKMGFLSTTYQVVYESLWPKVGDESQEFQYFDELEAYKIVFETCALETSEAYPAVVPEIEVEIDCERSFEAPINNCEADGADNVCTTESEKSKNPDRIIQGEINWAGINEPLSELLSLEQEKKEREESGLRTKEEKEVKAESTEPNKVEQHKEKPSIKNGSEAAVGNQIKHVKAISDKAEEKTERATSFGDMWSDCSEDYYYTPKSAESSEIMGGSLGSYGSMRKEKEWRRTLACKLFEERHNADGGGEGMDLLWETYENEANKLQGKSNSKKWKKGSRRVAQEEEEDEEDEDEDEENEGQLCCLQALKFSAGKMNLGMGKPNLVKISKALKGFGWLHNVTRHGRKSHR